MIKKVQIVSFSFLICLFSIFCFTFPANAQQNDKEATSQLPAVEGMEKIEKAHVDVEDAISKTELAQKELEVQKKEIELHKQKAEVARHEAEIAHKEVANIKEITKDKSEINKAIEKAKIEQKEAEAAIQKLGIAEEKLLAAQKKIDVAEKEAVLARERAGIAEAQVSGRLKVTYRKLIKTGLILFLGYFLILLLVGLINRRVKDLKLRHLLRRNTAYVVNFVIILSIIYVWSHNIASITIFFSVIGAGVALALQEVILCVAGWITILIRSPFDVGDRIEFGGIKGDVIDIHMLSTAMLEIGNWIDSDQSTGRIVEVPNSNLFKMACFNYSRGFEFIWNEIKILVTFESDWKKAKDIMVKHANDEAKDMEDIVKRKITKMTLRYMIFFDKLTPVVYTNIKDSGVELTLRYLTEAVKRRASQDRLCQDILDDFAKEENVNFAYPTYRIVKS